MFRHVSDARDLVRIRKLVESGAARAIREAAALSLTEISASADVDRTTVWRWEHGERRPRGSAALRYLRVLEDLSS